MAEEPQARRFPLWWLAVTAGIVVFSVASPPSMELQQANAARAAVTRVGAEGSAVRPPQEVPKDRVYFPTTKREELKLS